MIETNDEKLVTRRSRKERKAGVSTRLDPHGIYTKEDLGHYFSKARTAYAYTRLSRKDKENETSHFESMRRKASERGIEIIREYKDADESSLMTLENPQLNVMLNRLGTFGGVDIVIIPEISRLTRAGTEILSRALKKFQECGVPVWFCNSHNNLVFPNEGTSTEDFILYIEATMAKNQYDAIKKTLGGGKMASRLRGSYVDVFAPLGYRTVREGLLHEYSDVDGKRTRKSIQLEVVEESATFVKFLFEKCIELKSLDALMLHLEENEIKIPNANGENRVPVISEVVDILKNETYIGNLSTRRKKHTLTSRKYFDVSKRSRSEWTVVRNACPAIVDEETFRKVQKVVVLFRENSRRSNAAPLSNLVICGKCGRPMALGVSRVETKKGNTVRVELRKCTNKYDLGVFGETSCVNRGMRAESLLDEILNDVSRQILALQDSYESEEEAAERVLAEYRLRLEELDVLRESYEHFLSQDEVDLEIAKKVKAIESEMDHIDHRMELLELPERFKPIAVTKQERREALESFRESFSHDLSFKEQNLLLKTIIDSVEYYRMDDCPDMLEDVPEGVKYVLKINYR